jgi:hypothetical protein
MADGKALVLVDVMAKRLGARGEVALKPKRLKE